MVDISQLMIYQSPSWIVSYSYSRNCHDPSRYEHMLQKRLIPYIVDNLDGDDFFDSNNFFTLPNTLDDESFVHIIQQDTCLYDIQDLDPEDIAERLRIKKKQADKRRMMRMRWVAEIQAGKVKRLRRELWIAHIGSRTEDGILGIVWGNQEYWGTGFRVKR